MRVARRYGFDATHHLPGVEGYDRDHRHRYTVEVAVEGEVGRGGMIMDTGRMDELGDLLASGLDGNDLNAIFPFPTTVENLASHFRGRFVSWLKHETVEVTVWEDTDRWARAE